MYERQILAPGIILYKTGSEIIAGLKEELLAAIPPEEWKEAHTVNTETYEAEVSEGRKCDDFVLYENNVELKPLYDKISNWITPAYEDYVREYSVEPTVSDMWLILRYGDLGKFDHHVDDGGKFPRTISLSAYINDDYEGGELEFHHFGIKHVAEVGDIVIFSSAFPYMHKVSPVTSGTRYSIVNWYRYATYLREIV